MQKEESDELAAFEALYGNLDENVAGENGSGQIPSHSPPHTPMALENENEGEEEVKRDLEEGQKREEDMRAAELDRREKRHKEFEALSLRLSENGYKMRMKVWAEPTQAFRPMPMTAPTKTLAEVLQTVPLEDAA